MSRRKQSNPKYFKDDEIAAQTQLTEQSKVESQQLESSDQNGANSDEEHDFDSALIIDHDQEMSDEEPQNDDDDIIDDGLETPLKTSEYDEEILQPTPESYCDSDIAPSLPSTAPSSPAPGGSLNTPNRKPKLAKVGVQKNNITPVADKSGAQKFICPICNKMLGNQHELTIHIRNHNSKVPSSHSCTICNKVLCSQSSLDRHMLVHSGERPFKCSICHVAFTTNGNMHRHMRVHEKELARSTLYPTGTPMIPSLPEAKKGKKRKSDGFGSDAKRRLYDELSADDLRSRSPSSLQDAFEDFSCLYCNRKFLSTTVLEVHMEEAHPDKLSMEKKMYGIGEESEEKKILPPSLSFVNFPSQIPFSAKTWMENNINREASFGFTSYECIPCKETFPCQDEITLHMEIHCSGGTHCKVCEFDLPSIEDLNQHLMSVHVMESSPKKDAENSPVKSDTHSIPTSPRSEENNNSSDFADVQKIIQTANGARFPSPGASGRTTPSEDEEGIKMDWMQLKADNDFESERSDSPTPELSIVESGSECSNDGVMSQDGQKSKFTCKYCETTFPTFTAMKVHMRTHLGLSPYKCNQCSYASPDKTTLIRHLRTHNGERPFQCKICDFAFTTKANCERHVRKKHHRETKEEIDESVGYNQFMQDNKIVPENLMSGDTICKYCGVDFKFFRALKHHLRSHSSCRQKPFVCTLCDIGFSTKANCIRHIQKRHPTIAQTQIDKCIKTNTPAVSPARPGNNQGAGFLKAQMQMSQLSQQMSQFIIPQGGYSGLPFMVPPPAHGSKITAQKSQSLAMQLAAPPMNFFSHVKQEQGNENPLNLALKSEPGVPPRAAHEQSINARHSVLAMRLTSDSNQMEPLDLTKRDDMPSSVSPVPNWHVPTSFPDTSSPLSQQGHIHLPTNRTYKCPICNVQFSQEVKLHIHMRTHTTNRPYQCTYCPAGFTIKTNLDIHVRTRHLENSESHSDNKLASPTSKALNKRKQGIIKRFGMKDKSLNSSADSTGDLASVSNILNNTNSDKIQGFLNNSDNEHDDDEIIDLDHEMEDFEEEDLLEGEKSMRNAENAKNMKMFGTVKEEMEFKDEERMHEIFQNYKEMMGEEEIMPSPDQIPKKKKNSYASAPNKVSCTFCGRTFPWISSLRRHILTHTGQKPFKCPECNVYFSTKSNRERHLLRKHGLNPNNPHTRNIMDRPYKCNLCIFSSFSKPEKLIMHYKAKHPELDPPQNIQNLASTDKWNQLADKASESGDSAINTSGESDRLTAEQDSMYREEDEEEMDNSLSAYQGEIDRASTDADSARPESDILTDDSPDKLQDLSFQEPQGQVPARFTINPERDNYNVDKILDCWLCTKHFETRKVLLRHLREHNIDFPYKCYLCDASYISRIECLKHKDEKHEDDWAQLRERNKITEIESFSFTMDKLAESTDVKEEDTKIDENGTATPVERKVFCSLCVKKFWSLQDLRRHMRSHTGEKPFECDICGRYFTLKHSMMRHRRKHGVADNEHPVRPYRRLVYPDGFNGENPANDSHDEGYSAMERETSGAPVETFKPVPSRGTRKITPVLPDKGDYNPNDNSNLIGNLLGIEDPTMIDDLLSSADSAAQVLGVNEKKKLLAA